MVNDIVPTDYTHISFDTGQQTPAYVFPDTGHLIRTHNHNGDTWFVGIDVAAILGLTDPRKSLNLLDEDERHTIPVTDVLGRQQDTIVINEPGLYSLILRSRRPEARAFKRWITHDVIPAIRKTGRYEAAPAIPQSYAEALRAHADAVELAETRRLELEAAAPKVEAFDTYLSATGRYTIAQVAKLLGVPEVGPIKLYAFLRARDVLMTGGTNHNVPYQRHIDLGRFTVEGAVRRNSATSELITREDGKPIGEKVTHVTPKGIEFVRKMLVQAGHRPLHVDLG